MRMSRSAFTGLYRRMCGQLVQARKSRNLTQIELARQLGQHQSFVSKLERGDRRIDVVELLEILAVLGVDPASFVRELSQHRKKDRK